MKDQRWDLPERLPPAPDVDCDARETFYQRNPPAAFMDAVRARRPGIRWLPAAGLVAGGALAAALIIAVAPWDRPDPDPRSAAIHPSVTEDVAFGAQGAHRHKSTLRPHAALEAAPVDISVVAQRGDGHVPVEDGARVAPQTRIRFLYDSQDYDYLMLVSVTGDGEVSILYPMSEGPSIQIVRGQGIPLHGAVQLDDHLGPERFFALFSQAPMAFDQVEAAVKECRRGPAAVDDASWLRDLRRLPLGDAQATLLIEKDPSGDGDDG